MQTVDFTPRMSLRECAELIAAVGETNTILIKGEKGVGKSSILKIMPEYVGPGYEYAYFDMGNKSDGDAAIPFPDKERRVMEFFVNTALKIHTGKPVIIMLDEFGKAPRSIQNMMHTLLEVDNKRIQDTPLPKGSRVLITTNLAEEGLGDVLLEHTLDRCTVVEVRKPDFREWLPWAEQKGVSPVVRAFVHETPQVLASFRDEDFDEDNAYVYNPKRVQGKYITPRGLELASNVVKQRDKITGNALTCALHGILGPVGAASIADFIAYQDDIPTRESILSNPDTAPIPESVGATVTLLFNLESAIAADTITPIMKYVNRLDKESQAVFCVSVAANQSKNKIAFTNKSFTDWCTENHEIL